MDTVLSRIEPCPERNLVIDFFHFVEGTMKITHLHGNSFRRDRKGYESRHRKGNSASLTLQSQTFGILSQTAGDRINSPRQMQLALKIYF
jgi:hypothetical protein